MPNTKTLIRSRLIAYHCQQGCCYYCGVSTWLPDSDPIEFVLQTGLKKRQVRGFQATAEHVRARCDGGGNGQDNIVVACWFCNKRRHARKTPMAAEQFRVYVKKRVDQGRWHAALS